jgi:hypothetical protein
VVVYAVRMKGRRPYEDDGDMKGLAK